MHKIRWQHVAVGIVSTLLCSPLVFASTSSFAQQYPWHSVMNFTAGAAFNSDAGVSRHYPATPQRFTSFNYAAGSANKTAELFGAFAGAELTVNPAWLLQAGLGYYQPAPINAKGIVTQGVDGDSSNQYGYQYGIQPHQLLVEGKLLYNNMRIYHPYLSAGLGVSFNDSQDFRVNIQPPFTTMSNQFGNNNVSSFTYMLGFGVDVDITHQARVGIGYRFTDFGRSQTGSGTLNNIATVGNFSQNHLYTSEVVAQFTFAVT